MQGPGAGTLHRALLGGEAPAGEGGGCAVGWQAAVGAANNNAPHAFCKLPSPLPLLPAWRAPPSSHPAALQNRKPRLSPKGAHSLTAQQRLWDMLVQQTGTDFVLPQPEAGAV